MIQANTGSKLEMFHTCAIHLEWVHQNLATAADFDLARHWMDLRSLVQHGYDRHDIVMMWT